MVEFAGGAFAIRLTLVEINEFKQTYLNELADGTYQETIYFNYLDEKKTKIDFSSVTWYGIPDEEHLRLRWQHRLIRRASLILVQIHRLT